MRRILQLVCCLYSILVCPAVEDLGVISPLRAIHLDKDSIRPDFLHFKLEIETFYPSNRVVLIRTNSLLTVQDLGSLPSGKSLLGLVSVYSDGVSDPVFYRFFIWRGDKPPPPKAFITYLSGSMQAGGGESSSLERERAKRSHAIPPLPFMMRENGASLPDINIQRGLSPNKILDPPPPLPQGKNKTYGDKEDDMARFYSKHGRRNE